MSKKNKKRKRRLNREQLRETVAPTKDFEIPNPNDADDIIIVTAQRLSPGHLLEMNSSSLIKAYQENEQENADSENANADPENADETQRDTVKNFKAIVENAKYAAEVASIAIIDIETGERLYTQEDCMQFFLPASNTQIANWALMGAAPQQGENADSADRFPAEPEQQEEPELAAEAG